MSVAVDVFNIGLSGLDVLWSVVKPYKEAIFGLLTIAGGGAATFYGAYRRQARRPEEALSEAAQRRRTVHVTITRFDHDDRELIKDARDSVLDFTRAAKKLTTALNDQAEACRYRPAGRGQSGA